MTSTKESTRDIVYLAAVLHDIGKFWQRADSSGVASSTTLDSEVKNLESIFCPTYEGRYTHKHVLWTAQFFVTFKNLFDINISSKDKSFAKSRLLRFASAHHRPNKDSLEECIIQFADHCSSGIDRSKKEGLEDEQVEYDYDRSNSWDKFKDIRMKSVFENLLGNNTDNFKLPIASLDLNKSFFPKNKFEQRGQLDYSLLWESFSKELFKIQTKNIKQLTDSILFLLEKYTSTVPSSTQHLPDVSLFEHLKSTAAFSICTYDYLNENKEGKCNIKNDETPFVLLGGDLSGIQSFIFDIVGKGAAKNLKGRSFYLQLIVDSIVSYIIEKLNLYKANIVYSSGGGFYILAPNTKFVKDQIKEISSIISERIRKEHSTKLYLALDYQPIKKEDVFNGNINLIWAELSQKLSQKKANRFSDFIKTVEGFSYFFEPTEAGGETLRDFITGEEFERNEIKYPLELHEKETENISYLKKNTFEQIRLGKILRDNIQYQISTSSEIKYWESDYKFLGTKTHRYFRPLGLDRYYYFLSEKEISDLKQRIKGSVDDAEILKVNDTNFNDFKLSGNNIVNGFTFYGGNDMPRTNDKAQFFDELAGDESVTFKRLGILRMDVDGLGNIFKNGFPDMRRTFSRYSTLSSSLDYFFKGYLNKIWAESERFRSNTFILYSGGDDLFIIGKWNVAIEFADVVQKEFKEWTCHNPHLGISGGIAIVTGKYPIAKAAIQSAEEEKRAKNHSYKNKDKDSISFLSLPFSWDEELEVVETLKNQLINMINTEHGISKGFLSKISTLNSMKELQEKNGLNPTWRWLSAYDIGRTIQIVKSREAKALLEVIKINLFTNKEITGSKYDYLQVLNFAARWAQLEMRS
jgi:CRISPR-associated protein Csm1